ncbi:hypothetical protein SAY87_011498 [Trapa incisa]|uniref:YqaJ viral recombinase domain-containing protein n=1 Tax=Trapa incisa TaxID=236973 RepID=A0AAN7GJC7_9MYRT|nr:hypothetical protein SAY87_011498 [Trapa incisa]
MVPARAAAVHVGYVIVILLFPSPAQLASAAAEGASGRGRQDIRYDEMELTRSPPSVSSATPCFSERKLVLGSPLAFCGTSMHHTPHGLTRHVLICCSFIARLPYLGITSRKNTHFFGSGQWHIRDYSGQAILEPIGSRFPPREQALSLPSRQDLSNIGHNLKFVSGDSRSVIQKDCFKHPFKNWQEERKHKLTASTFAGALGFWSGRRVKLWLEKIGAREPFSGNLAICWNNMKEEEAVERYKEITGNSVLFPKFQIYGGNHPEDDWIAASPDGAIDSLVYGLPSRGVLEIKCPFFQGDIRRALPWRRIPFYYIPQAQGLMEIMDRDWMDFYVWTPRGTSLFRILRDEEYWGALKEALSDFWFKHVEPARDICSKYVITDPLTQLKLLRPEPKHELCSYIAWESNRIVYSSKLLVREIGGRLEK